MAHDLGENHTPSQVLEQAATCTGRPGRVSPTVVESVQFLRESEVQGSARSEQRRAASEVPSSGSHLTEPQMMALR